MDIHITKQSLTYKTNSSDSLLEFVNYTCDLRWTELL